MEFRAGAPSRFTGIAEAEPTGIGFVERSVNQRTETSDSMDAEWEQRAACVLKGERTHPAKHGRSWPVRVYVLCRAWLLLPPSLSGSHFPPRQEHARYLLQNDANSPKTANNPRAAATDQRDALYALHVGPCGARNTNGGHLLLCKLISEHARRFRSMASTGTQHQPSVSRFTAPRCTNT